MAEYFAFKQSNCKNCYKCIRHCPVKAISFRKNQARVIANECILCGECFVVCPQNAKTIRDDLLAVKNLLQKREQVVASVAPAFVASMPGVSFETLRKALIKIGFSDAEETAIGAAMVKKQYEDIVREGKQRIVISTCCHSVNLLVQKYYPEVLPYLAGVVSPMMAHGMDILRRNEGAKVVFIGPCISKIAEAKDNPGIIDSALTFDDLHDWFEELGIELEQSPPESSEIGRTRLFPIAGGIINSMDIDDTGYEKFIVDGVDDCIKALKDISAGGIGPCFIEMSACSGSCVSGPAMGHKHRLESPLSDRMAVRKFAGVKDFDVSGFDKSSLAKTFPFNPIYRKKPGSKAIEDMLVKMGKSKPEEELNCGSCGYETCRDKAAAILAGKAEISMCLPYLMARAESFSDNIITNTPNGIIVLNRALEIQQINEAACNLFKIKADRDVLGRHVVCILDPSQFDQLIISGRASVEKLVYIAEYKLYVMMTIVFDRVYDLLICFMRDVTSEKTAQDQKGNMSRHAVEIADKVIEKHMRTVQEIASLLGETTAETKVALEKLKETLRYDE